MTILTCEWFLITIGPSCLSLPPLGGRVSNEALFRGRTVDEHREVDEGRRYRNGRYAHDGDLLGIVGSALAFLPSPSPPPPPPLPSFRNNLSFKPSSHSRPGWKTPVQSRNKPRPDQCFTLQFSVEKLQEITSGSWQTFLCVVDIMSLWVASGELVPAVCLASLTHVLCHSPGFTDGALIPFKLVLLKKRKHPWVKANGQIGKTNPDNTKNTKPLGKSQLGTKCNTWSRTQVSGYLRSVIAP